MLGPGRMISPLTLSRYLELLEGQDPDSVQKLLYPSDPQDVPRAIELMQAIVSLRSLQLDSQNPDVIADLDAIRLLSDLCEAILEAYTNPNLTLTEQVQYLSKYAHLTFAFFRQHRLAFMSNQLYGDSQCMVKNAIFCIAKQQALDPSQDFHLFELGDDRLEKLFGRLRMLGAHDSGMRYNQGVDRLGHAVDIDAALARNPDLDGGQRRLKITGTAALDHLNVASWKGDASVKNVSLSEAWADGRRAAEDTILRSQMPDSCARFVELFQTHKIDLLCPFQAGKYPGVDDSEEDMPDRSILADETAQQAAHETVPVTPIHIDATSAATTSINSTSDSQAATLPSAAATTSIIPATAAFAINTSTAASSTLSSSSFWQPVIPSPTSEASDDSWDEYTVPSWLFDDAESAEIAITLEEALPEEVGDPSALPLGPGIVPDDWLLCNGRHIHKQSICRLVINADFIHKSKNRPERVRGFTKPTWQPHLNSSAHLIGPDTFVVGDHFVTLVRHQDIVSLALVRSTKILRGKVQVPNLPVVTITNPQSNVQLEGQVMTMHRVWIATPDDDATSQPSNLRITPDNPPSMNPHSTSHLSLRQEAPLSASQLNYQWVWVWDGGFVMADAKMRGSDVVTEKACTISVAGRLCSLQVASRSVIAHSRLFEEDLGKINSAGTTWEVDEEHLLSLSANLWETSSKDKIRVDTLPVLPTSAREGFPYVVEGVSTVFTRGFIY